MLCILKIIVIRSYTVDKNQEENNVNDLSKRPDESVFEYTQRVRLAVVENLTAGGIPADDGLDNLAKFLDSMDKQEATKKRIEQEDDAQQSDRKAQEIIHGIINLIGNTNPYESEQRVERVVEVAGDLTEVTLVPGELDTNQRVLNYEDFMKEYRKNNPKETELDDE